MIKQLLQVVIFQDRTGEECDGACGMDWSLPENRQLATESLKERFGSEVEVEYVELSDLEGARNHPEILERIKREELTMPLLVINGDIRISGYFDIRMLMDMVEAGMELEG